MRKWALHHGGDEQPPVFIITPTTLGGVGVEGDPRPDGGHPFLVQECPADIMPVEAATSPPNPWKLGSRPRRLGDRQGPGARGPGRGVRY